MKAISVDRTTDGRFTVKVATLARTTVKTFDTHAAAARFSLSKLTGRAILVDTCNMTPEQLAAHEARKVAQRAWAADVARVAHEIMES